MNELLSSWLGTAFYSVCIFMVGAWIGRPMLGWLGSKMPWSEDY
jgi:hypothetical protein